MDKPIQNQNLPSAGTEVIDLEDLMKQDDTPDDENVDKDLADETELANRLSEKKVAKKDEKDEDEDEQKEIKLEDEKPEEKDEDDLELVTPVRRKEILKKYPTLFKDFPYLEKAYYREQKFTEIFPTLNDAKEAQEKIELFENLQGEVIKGDISTVLDEIAKNDKEAFAKVVDNYLPTLHKVNENAYYHVVGNLVKETVQKMFNEGKRIENEALQSAAVILHQFVFGTSEYTPPAKLAKEENKDNSVQEERKQFVKEKFEYHLNDLTTKIDNTLTATIDGHIDPNSTMSAYVRKNAVRDCLDSLKGELENDSRLKVIKDKLWEQAFKDGFQRPTLERIRSAYLSRAKVLLPELIKRTRNEAMRGLRNESRGDKREPIERGRSTGPNLASRGKKDELPKGMRTLDFFNQD